MSPLHHPRNPTAYCEGGGGEGGVAEGHLGTTAQVFLDFKSKEQHEHARGGLTLLVASLLAQANP